ncbi:sacsin N-terminal ATP-binding-like domain-containing protein [Streptomyces spectabilis]|uniref:DUF3883 domain-containing protein n=1 Tax=Streptomyces spectabilis TaxID=68270 RepID=A0A516R294_STRST|nr:DUF3883 domain-containing protein [Streptomyces spectabilis]QDQ09774.1 DUF3883 domain-containing protein [Streptomyces spectabilis]
MTDHAYGARLRDYALKVLHEWQLAPTWQPGLQLRAASLSNARDYAGRFLLELLQNAHDAHPKDRGDGRVHVLLDEDEGEAGTLYVANGGTPFTWERVESVCKFARSNKAIGEGIGNKGVGFRSILQITEAPEIYSAASEGRGPGPLDGYCFRFARGDDLVELLQDEATAHKAHGELPPFQVPFPVTDVPDVCAELAALGYVTVVRLPLRGAAALDEVRLRLRELAEAKAPVMLFLARIARLTLEWRADGGVRRVHELTRAEEPFAVPAGEPLEPGDRSPRPADGGTEVTLARVGLEGTGEFLVARGPVAPERLRRTVAEATGLGLLDDVWLEWSEPAVIEIAVPLAAGKARRGQTYTFLPLGDGASAPLAAHVNAPFFTKMDRTGLDAEHPLNAMLFDALAETCLAAAERLRAARDPGLRRIAVDLVSWETGKRKAGLLVTAARRVHGRELADVPLVPVLAADGAPPHTAWAAPRHAVLWPEHDLAVLTARRAHDAGAVVADPDAGGERLKRLASVCKGLGCPWEPAPDALAAHVERMIATLPLPGPGDTVEIWDDVYDDMAALFQDDGTVLRGRRLLLADDGTLRHANGQARPDGRGGRRARREAFFQPVRGDLGGDGDTLSVPAVLGKRLFSLHPGLTWTDRERHSRRQPARFFLEHAGLVRPFDVKGLLEHVRRALAESKDRKLRDQALRFVFRLWRSRRTTSGMAVGSLGLYVPSADGTPIRAGQAVLGRGWDGACGDDLVVVVEAGQEASPSLKRLARRLTAPPEAFLRRGESAQEWRAFLLEAGVSEGLSPVYATKAVRREYGQDLVTSRLVRMANVPPGVAAQWEPHVARPSSGAWYPQTPYEGSPAFWLPGQEVVGRLGESARLAYARLVLRGLADWTDRYFTSTWTSAGSRRDDRERVRTPLAAFLREQPWLPVRGRGRTVRFVRPADAWYCPPGLDEEPLYAPGVDRRVRPLVEPQQTGVRLRSLGLPTWDDPRDSARLVVALGRLVAGGEVGGDDRPAAQRANERAWKHLVKQASGELPGDARVLAEAGERLIAVRLSDLGGPSPGSEGPSPGVESPDPEADRPDSVLYVSGERESLTARLVREMGRPLLVVPGVAAEAAARLGRGRQDAVRHVDDATFSVTVDGEVVNAAALGEPLVEELPWLTLAVGVLADHVAEGPRPSDAELADLTAVVRRVRLHRYRTWAIALDGHPVTMPGRLGGVLPLPDAKHPLLLTRDAEPGWAETARLAPALADLLGHRDFGIRLRLAALHLASCHADPRMPAPDELAEALGVTRSQVDETSRRVDGAVGGVLERCLPLLVHLLGPAAAQALTVPPPRDTREFQAALDGCAGELPLPPDEFVRLARTARDLDELRLLLDLDFAALNDTLRTLPGAGPVSHAEAHEEALRGHLDLHRKVLVNRLRWARLDAFDACEPLPDWPALRTLDWITAPETWAYTVDTAEPPLIEAHVEEQLALRLGTPAPREGEHLPPVDQVRSGNRRVVVGAVADLVALVEAAGHPLPEPLAAANPAEAVTDRLDAAGALDFRLLAPDDVVGRLAALGHWPDGMPATVALDAHGLTTAAVDRVRHAAEHERRERERRRRTLSVGGSDIDLRADDLTDLTAALQRALDRQGIPGLGGGRVAFTRPQELPPARRPSGGERRGTAGRRGGADAGLSPAQRDAIGYMGEWYAYHWLCRGYPEAADETSWVSTNRRRLFPGPAGDDGLGYDFEVGSGKLPLMFEVKATQGDGGQLELGESEVRAAQRHAGNDRWRLLVVTRVLEPERVGVRMLPNPFGRRGRGRYREEGGALRFSYRW